MHKDKIIKLEFEDFSFLKKEVNDFSLFFEELDELKENNNDSEIYKYIKRTYGTQKEKEEFYNYFYKNENILTAKEFSTIGVFEDLYFYPKWMNDKKLEIIVKQFKEKYNIYYWRRIKGDGNCFYRAVLVSYLEKLISLSIRKLKPSIFFSFIKEFLFTKFPDSKEDFHKKAITVLFMIYEEIQKNKEASFDMLYRVLNYSDSIEKTIILWFKIKLSEFLKKNLELEIQGIKLIQFIPELELNENDEYDKDKILEYIDDKLLKMNEYVEGYPLYITPFILQCNLDIFYLNTKSKIYSLTKEQMRYIKDLVFVPVESFLPNLLNIESHNTISILFNSPHYESLADREHVNEIISIYNNEDFLMIEGFMNEKEYDKYKTDILDYSNKLKFLGINKMRNNTLNSNSDTQSSTSVCKKCKKDNFINLSCGCSVCIYCAYFDIIQMQNTYRKIKDMKINICNCKYVLQDSDINLIIGMNSPENKDG